MQTLSLDFPTNSVAVKITEIDVAVTVAVTTLQPPSQSISVKDAQLAHSCAGSSVLRGKEEEQKLKLENLSSTSCLTRRYLQIWEQL